VVVARLPATPLFAGITREGSGVINLRTRATAVIAAAIVTTGSAVGITIATATPAHALTCHPVLVHNGGHYLDDYGGGSGSYVHTYPYTASTNQTWCLEVASQGGYYFHPENNTGGLCLDAHTYTSGQRIWVYTCNGTLPQRWCWNGTGYIVTRGNSSLALRDNGLYNIVTINQGGNNKWSYAGNTAPPPDNC